MKKFDEIFEDKTKYGTKIPTSEYYENGKNIIVDQGQNQIAGYTNKEEGIFCEIPAIIFGDHTRIVKYVDKPFFMGADGVKILRSKLPESNYKYLYYALKNVKLQNTGYNRHFKWLKEIWIKYPNIQQQQKVAYVLDCLCKIIEMRKQQIQKLDDLIKARFVEMFGDPIKNDKQWVKKSIVEVCKEIYGGGTPSKSHPEYYENGNIPWVSSKDMKKDIIVNSDIYINRRGIENSTAKIVPVDSVIMVIRSGILKHTLPVAINAVEITVNQDLKVFIPKKEIISRFLCILFKMMEKDILSGVRAVTADNIDFNSFINKQIIVPPIENQEHFVAFVHQVDKSRFAEMLGDISTGEYKYIIKKLGDVAKVGSSHRVFTTDFG